MHLLLTVPGMTCGACAAAVRNAIVSAAPGAAVEVDLASGKVAIDSAALPKILIEAVRGAGFEAAEDPA